MCWCRALIFPLAGNLFWLSGIVYRRFGFSPLCNAVVLLVCLDTMETFLFCESSGECLIVSLRSGLWLVGIGGSLVLG